MKVPDKDRLISYFPGIDATEDKENVKIIVDKLTGVQYLRDNVLDVHGNAGGMTVLVDKDGKPLVVQAYPINSLVTTHAPTNPAKSAARAQGKTAPVFFTFTAPKYTARV